jgi:hypothetical protein
MPWNLIIGWLVNLAIRFGLEALIQRFPNMPAWLLEILKRLIADKQAAKELPVAYRRGAVKMAKRAAITQVAVKCRGLHCEAKKRKATRV